jgi:hypothetical protein
MPLLADTHTAASCSRNDVQAAINASVHGDTVQIPAGVCTWTTMLQVTVGITLRGAGEGVTTIIDNVPKIAGGESTHLLRFVVNAPNNIRLTALSIQGQAEDPQVFNLGHIVIAGTMTAFRVDHITVTNPQTAWIRTAGCVYGLIDHITYNGEYHVLSARHTGCGNSDWGDGSWATPIDWGGPKAIYVENSTFISPETTSVTNFFDGHEGQRVVIRHNQLSMGNVTSHGADSGQRQRGSRHMEVYNNTFSFLPDMAVDFVIWIRGGTGVVFNNTVTVPGGVNSLVKMDNCRDSDAGCTGGQHSFPPWGACNGLSPYDQNSVGGTGYRCVDQPGSGTSNNLGGLLNPIAQWVGNILDPIYIWNNTTSEVPSVGIDAATEHVQPNRDYYVGTARPGYTPYTYPHTLTETTPPVPGNSGTITTSSIGSLTLTLNWNKATDNITAQPELLYEVVRSTSNNISTVAAAEANGTVIRTYAADIGTFNVTGLNASSTYFFTVIVKDTAGNKAVYATKSETTLVALSLSPSTLPPGTVGVSYNQTITASGAAGPYTFSVAAGTLPSGMTLNSSSGALSGTPTFPGNPTFTIRATTPSGHAGDRVYTVALAGDFSNNVTQIVTGATFDSTPFPGFVGRFTISVLLQNQSLGFIGPMFFKITELHKSSPDVNPAQPNRLLSADNGAGDVGDIQTLPLSTFGTSQTTDTVFDIGLGSRQPFSISVALYAVPPIFGLTTEGESFKGKNNAAAGSVGNLVGVFNFNVSEEVISSLSRPGKPEEFGTITNIGVLTGPGPQSRATIAIDPVLPRRMAVASNDSGGKVIVSTTEDGGQTWRPTRMSHSLGDVNFFNAQSPSIAFDKFGRLSVVYVLANMNDAANAVVISESVDGINFAPPSAIVSHTAAENVIVSRPVIAINSRGGRYVAWENFGSRINVVRSEEGGLFGPPITVVSNSQVSSPTIAIGKTDVHIGWNEWGFNSKSPFQTGGRLMMASAPHKRLKFPAPREIARTNIGFSSPKIRALPMLPFGVAPNLALAVDSKRDNLIYAAFTAKGDGLDIQFARSFDSGKRWKVDTLKDGAAGGDQFSPALDIDDDRDVYISYYDTLSSESQTVEVFVARRQDAYVQLPDLPIVDFILRRWFPNWNSFEYHQITTAPIEESRKNLGIENGTNLGDRTAIAISPDNIVIGWTDTRAKTEDVYLSILSPPAEVRAKNRPVTDSLQQLQQLLR